MWKTLQGFMGAFPQYSRNGFSFTTESYGGHYGPVFNGEPPGLDKCHYY
jgi:carboxypeptidase C (cathepsin A)